MKSSKSLPFVGSVGHGLQRATLPGRQAGRQAEGSTPGISQGLFPALPLVVLMHA
jgi:hypothetical protein